MNNTKQKLISRLGPAVAAALVMAATASLNAATVVNWGPSTGYATGSLTLNRYVDSGGQNTIAYSDSASLSPTGILNPGPTFNARYYGAAKVTQSDGNYTNGNGLNNARLLNDQAAAGGNDMMSLSTRSVGRTGATVSITGLYLFNKADFLGGGASAAVALDSTSTVSGMFATQSSNNPVVLSRVALVVQQGGLYYRSGFLNEVTTGITTAVNFDMSTISWFDYDPTLIDDFSGSAASVSFTDISAIGYLQNATKTSSAATSGNNLQLFSSNFTVNATLVPEPGTIALCGLGLLAVVGRKVLRRRNK